MSQAYEYRHGVTFEETNLLGNVYYVHYVRWQGICRERFLHERAPEVLREIDRGLVLSTVRCACRYGKELLAFDQVVVRMRLKSAVWNRVVLDFEYLRETQGQLEPVAYGEQEIACRWREGGQVVDREIPACLLEALEPFRAE
jgi:enediyne biosynthesis thioesterase